MPPLPDEKVMDPEIKARWVAALRSGEYIQAHDTLRDGLSDEKRMCCLGVLCDVIEPSGWHLNAGAGWYFTDPGTDTSNACYVPIGLRQRLGLTKRIDGEIEADSILANRNDGKGGYPKHTFAEIADWIEENL